MRSTNVIALFCEDIREEKGETVTLVGVIPDNVTLADPDGANAAVELPRFLAKLSIFLRINFDPETDIGSPSMKLISSNGEEVDLGKIDPEIARKARTEARDKGNVLAGVVVKVALAGFRPPRTGAVRIEVEINEETYVAGALAFRPKE